MKIRLRPYGSQKILTDSKPDELDKMPRPHEARDKSAADRFIHLHFSWGDIEYYAVEYDGEDTFYGYVDYHDPINEPEWNSFHFQNSKTGVSTMLK